MIIISRSGAAYYVNKYITHIYSCYFIVCVAHTWYLGTSKVNVCIEMVAVSGG